MKNVSGQMKCFMVSLLLLSAVQVFALTPSEELVVKLLADLPLGTYAGRNNGHNCQVVVSNANEAYTVHVSQDTNSGVQQMTFILNKNSKVKRSDVGRENEFIETYVSVETGKTVQFEQVYGKFAELTFGLDVRKITGSAQTKNPKARKIWVTKTRAGNIGGSGPACIIELPNRK